MARKTKEQLLQETLERAKTLKAEIAKANRKQAQVNRKRDDQKKYALAGAFLALLEKQTISQDIYNQIVNYIDSHETRNNIRVLFNLTPVEPNKQD